MPVRGGTKVLLLGPSAQAGGGAAGGGRRAGGRRGVTLAECRSVWGAHPCARPPLYGRLALGADALSDLASFETHKCQ